MDGGPGTLLAPLPVATAAAAAPVSPGSDHCGACTCLQNAILTTSEDGRAKNIFWVTDKLGYKVRCTSYVGQGRQQAQRGMWRSPYGVQRISDLLQAARGGRKEGSAPLCSTSACTSGM